MSAEDKKLQQLIDKRRKWLYENRIQDWTDADTEFVCKEYANIRAREVARATEFVCKKYANIKARKAAREAAEDMWYFAERQFGYANTNYSPAENYIDEKYPLK